MGCIHSKGCIGHVPDSPRQEPKVKDRMKAIVIESAHSSASSNEEDGDDEDRLHVLCANRDSDMGISRLSRVSSQFLPPEGSKTVRVPLGDYELRYSFLSQRGFYPEALDKPNQDSFCIHTPFGTNPNDHFFGVFDGHGDYGAECSQFVKRKLCENLLRNCCLQVDVIEAIHASFLTTNSQLHADVLDDSMSGTTAIAILVRGRTIYVANAGDSRAIIAERRGKDIAAIDLSIDQTPFRSDELERVRHCGARVLTLDQIEGLKNPDVKCWGTEEDDDGDPPRLWVQSGMYPGTAFTRSIGDSIAESIGVVASPEIYALELTHNHPFFVIASDGVFEFLSSQTVVEMVAKFKDPRDACAAIVAESYRLWLRYETRTDDITIIVVHVNGLNEAEDVQSTLEAPSRTLPHVIEETGSESPFLGTLNSRSHRVRHELSRMRLKPIESSLVNGDNWFPPVSHRKTWEEEAHIERVIRDHFLFKKLTNSQCLILLDCMKKVEVKPGDVVVEQGGEGDCFYVVTNGEFEVLATQEEGMEVVTKVLHRYTAEKLSSFGELALMYNKPLQSSVRAVTAGTLWALKREDFRGILTSEFSNIASFKLLRSVEPFSRLTILQLSRIAESLVEVSFSDGQTIIEKDVPLLGLYIIQKGLVRLSYIADSSSPVTSHLFSTDLDHRTALQDNSEHVVELAEGSHFGEWTLFGELVGSLSASSIGDSVCLVITKEKFDSAVGSVPKLPQEDRKMEYSLGSSKETILNNDASTCQRINASDLEWKMTISATDCYEIGQVLLKGTDVVRTLMRFSRRKIEELGNEEQVMKEKKILMSFNASASVPPVLCTYLDRSHVGILLDCCLACSLSSILAAPLDENSVRFCAASLVVSLEELHKNSVLHRGISPDAVMVDQTGHLQLVDFRFAKKFGERTFNICGIADSSAPEIILGKGHGFAADWRALGALIYFLLRAETPFGSWTESELETFAEISKGYLTNNLLHTFSIEAVDFITKLLDVSEVTPFERDGPDSLKAHSWFNGVDWKQVVDGTFPVPLEITCRINAFLEKHVEQAEDSLCSPTSHEPELSSPEWLEDW